MSLDNLARVSSPHTVNKLCSSRLTGAQLHIRLLNGAGHTQPNIRTQRMQGPAYRLNLDLLKSKA